MPIVISAGIGRALKNTLDEIVTDPTDNPKGKLFYPKYMEVKSMSDQYEDDAEVAGSLLLQEKAEGAAVSVGSIQEGGVKRYTARTFALALHVAEEAIEDSKYDKYINAGKRLVKSAYKTQDIDATNVLIRATNTAYTGGFDNLVLGSASHTLPYGGTFSNIADTYQSPSRAAIIAARAKIMKYPSQNGLVEGWMPKALVCPVSQMGSWEGILGSSLVPDSNNNEINIVKGMKIELVAIPYWDSASTTAWGLTTTADNGLQWRNRRTVRSRTWVDNDADIMKYSVSYRATFGWSDPRGWYQGNT